MSSRAPARGARPSPPSLPAASVPGVVLRLLSLPKDAIVLCSSFAPLGDPATHGQSIELARRLLYADHRQPSLADSLLVHVDASAHDMRLLVFAVAARASQAARAHALASLALHNLIAVDSVSFDFRQLYSNSQSPAFVTPALHRIYLMFLAALRSRILADIGDNAPDRIRTSCVRMRDGFLLVPRPVNSEWSVGWDDPQRRLAYCHLHLHWMNASTIVLRPVFNTSPYSQLSSKHCPSGQPIALLPYAVPAFYIAPYTGSTAALSQHFRDSLVGLGVGPHWESQGYILCWIAVHNSQGDDKAVLTVWPAALAVACLDRPLADRLPTVPDHFAQAVNSAVAEKAFSVPRAHQRSLPFVCRQVRELQRVTNSVASFIDALAKERERERERAKEERYRRLHVSVPQSGSAGAGPRSTMSGSAGAYPPPGSASDHFMSPAIPLNTFTSPPTDPSALPPQSLNAAWGAPPQLDASTLPTTTASVDDLYSAFNLPRDSMADMNSFGLLTDEDFDFFDQPAVAMPPAEPPPTVDLGGGMGDIEMNLGMTMNMSMDGLDLGQSLDPHSHDGMGMPLYGTGWTPEYAPDPPRGDAFLPHDMLSALPSPAKTPWVPPLPEPELATADLVFARDPKPLSYDEVPFATAHTLADAKYSAGKFAAPLLSPTPSDEDGGAATLREQYGKATNPRVNIVKRLYAKRKSLDQGHRPSLSPWERGEPEWITYPPSSPEALPSPPSSEGDSSEDNDLGAGLFGDYDECDVPDDPALARAPTPVPDAVLIGPSLLHASFAHRTLVQLGVPFPAPTAATGAQPMSVPTPVSPAAAGAGATPFERARNLEPVAAAFAREVVENATWAAAWQLLGEHKERPVWREEIDQGIDALNNLSYLVPGSNAGLSVKPLHPPHITTEKGGNLVHVVPSALRFWEKLALGPRAGAKHVSAFVLYEDGSEVSAHIPSWLQTVSKIFSARNFGTHSTGKAGGHENGLVPLKWELFRKTLSNLLATMLAPNTPGHYAVFYVLVPDAMMTLSSTFLRNILGVATQHLKLPGGVTFDPDHMLIHLLPEVALLNLSIFPPGAVASSVYDRLPRIAERHAARAFFKRGLAWRAAFDGAAFTLARHTEKTKVDLQWDWPIEHLDVLEKHTLLHVAYRISRCGHWVLYATTDERGESHSLATWAHNPESTLAELVQEVWKRTMDLVSRTNVEWRVVIAKSGTIGREEHAAWASLLDKVFSEENPPSVQAALVSVHCAAPFTLVPQSLAHAFKLSNAATMSEERPTATSILSELAWQGFRLGPVGMQPLSIVIDEQAPVSEWSVREEAHTGAGNDNGAVPMASVSLLRAPSQPRVTVCHVHLFHLVGCPVEEATDILASIADNYSDLAILSQVRSYGVPSEPPALALHIAALERMDVSLSVSDLATEVTGSIIEQTS